MSGRLKVGMLVAAGVLVLAVAIPALARSGNDTAGAATDPSGLAEHSVTVSGSSFVTAKPDEAVISLGVFESEHWAECRSGIEDEPGDEPLLYWWPRRSPYT